MKKLMKENELTKVDELMKALIKEDDLMKVVLSGVEWN